jgi:uncharacterized protein (TIGR00255 family)
LNMSTTGSPSAAVNASKPRVTGLKSMTGYAQARAVENDWNLRITIRSVNHRFLDLHLRLPEGFEPVEPRIRKILRERVRRGHLDVNLHYELAGPTAVGVNEEVAAAYLTAINALRKQFSIQTEPDLAALFRLPGVIGAATGSLDKGIERIETVVVGMLNEALDRLDRMRAEEGVHLCHDMNARLGTITALTASVATLAERARPAFARRLEARLKELLGETPLDPTRLAQEVAIAAERSDVSEELARLGSHVQQFTSLIATGSDAGKKLDFLLQEMQRESNTLLSKTPGNEADGLEITRLGLEIKSEIEKLREQVQNIE